MKKLLIVLAFVILLSHFGFANIYQYGVTVELGEKVNYDMNILLINYTDSSFSIGIPGTPSGIVINSTAACNQIDSVWGKEIKCGISNPQKTSIEISYTGNEKVTKKDNYYIFADSLIMPDAVNKFSVLVKLPEGMAFLKKDAFKPSDSSLLGSDGRKLFILWNNDNLNKGYTFDFSVAYEPVNAFDYTIIGVILIALITGAVIIVVFLRYPKQKAVEFVLPVLKQDEKKIFETLLKHESGVKQKIIVTESGYSKAKVSKVLTSLQERGLVKLERIGRTNKIYYDDKFKKKL